jgi:predicted DNA-binding ribbon-helix-helix protein
MKPIDHNKNYASVRVKNTTYKNLKLLAIEEGMPVTQLIDLLYTVYINSKHANSRSETLK